MHSGSDSDSHAAESALALADIFQLVDHSDVESVHHAVQAAALVARGPIRRQFQVDVVVVEPPCPLSDTCWSRGAF